MALPFPAETLSTAVVHRPGGSGWVSGGGDSEARAVRQLRLLCEEL